MGSMKTTRGQHLPMVMMVKTTPKQQTRTYPIHWSCGKQGKILAASRDLGLSGSERNIVAVDMHEQQSCFTVGRIRSYTGISTQDHVGLAGTNRLHVVIRRCMLQSQFCCRCAMSISLHRVCNPPKEQRHQRKTRRHCTALVWDHSTQTSCLHRPAC